MTIEITPESVRTGLTAVVRERGKDFVYQVRSGKCRYVYAGMPDCGVGQFLANTGVPIERLGEADLPFFGTPAHLLLSQLQEEGVVGVDERSILALRTFQDCQDDSVPWGESLWVALNYLPRQAI